MSAPCPSLGPREIADRLADQALAFCQEWLPEGRRSGGYWHCADVDGGAGRSMAVRLSGPRAGKWTDYAEGTCGDLIDVIGEQLRLSPGEAIGEARRWLGLPNRNVIRKADPVDRLPSSSPTSARKLFERARPIVGTLGEAYLRMRGIAVTAQERNAVTSPLRFTANAVYRNAAFNRSEACPTLLCAITDASGAFIGVSRTYLSRHGTLARVADPRKVLGSLRCGAVRFGPANGDCDGAINAMLVGEGLETLLSVRAALPRMPAAAALTASNLRTFQPPDTLAALWIVQDADPPGEHAALALAERMGAERPSLEVKRLIPPRGDFNDLLRVVGDRPLHRRLRSSMVSCAEVGHRACSGGVEQQPPRLGCPS